MVYSVLWNWLDGFAKRVLSAVKIMFLAQSKSDFAGKVPIDFKFTNGENGVWSEQYRLKRAPECNLPLAENLSHIRFVSGFVLASWICHFRSALGVTHSRQRLSCLNAAEFTDMRSHFFSANSLRPENVEKGTRPLSKIKLCCPCLTANTCSGLKPY